MADIIPHRWYQSDLLRWRKLDPAMENLNPNEIHRMIGGIAKVAKIFLKISCFSRWFWDKCPCAWVNLFVLVRSVWLCKGARTIKYARLFPLHGSTSIVTQNHAVLWYWANGVGSRRNNGFQLDKEADQTTDLRNGTGPPYMFGRGKCDCRSSLGCLKGHKCRKRDQATSTRSLVVQVSSTFPSEGNSFAKSECLRNARILAMQCYILYR